MASIADVMGVVITSLAGDGAARNAPHTLDAHRVVTAGGSEGFGGKVGDAC